MCCIFCKIVNGEVESVKVWEDDNFMAFLDVNPVVEGHTVLIPKRHCGTIYDLDDAGVAGLGDAIRSVADLLKIKFGENVSIINTSGEYASQSVSHFHFHLIPRSKGDRLWDGDVSRIVLDRSSGFDRLSPSKDELEKLAQGIRAR